jgi:hypothetical protein
MFIKSILASVLLASSTATAFNGPAPNAIVSPKRHTGSALQMAGGAAPALKVCFPFINLTYNNKWIYIYISMYICIYIYLILCPHIFPFMHMHMCFFTTKLLRYVHIISIIL